MDHKSSYIWQVFRRTKLFLPVIHPVSEDVALKSIETAIAADADGIFLINQGMSADEVLQFVPEVHRRFGNLWIGVNLLGIQPSEVVSRVSQLPVGGIWSDNAMIDEESEVQPAAELFRRARAQNGWMGLYFGGVAFKYQREVSDRLLPVAAKAAAPWMDVITSSGPATGMPASIEKVKALRVGAGKHPIALASVISPENVDQYLPLVDAFLVASELETECYSGKLVVERTKRLADRIHGWRENRIAE